MAWKAVRGAKPRASYVKSGLVAISVGTTAVDFRHSVFWPQFMLHLRARDFAPNTDGLYNSHRFPPGTMRPEKIASDTPTSRIGRVAGGYPALTRDPSA
jgi:hypothetical protein